MGTTYTMGLAVGFVFTVEEALNPFCKVTPAVTKTEDRYDPKTGAKTTPAEITVEHRRIDYNIDGKPQDSMFETLEVLAKKLGVQFLYIGNHEKVVFCVNRPQDGEEDEVGYPLSVYPGEFPANKDWRPDLAALREKLVTLGLKPREPVIRIATSWH